MPVHDILFAVPAQDWEAEARAAYLDIRPAADSLCVQESQHAGTLCHHLPGAVGLLANQAVGHANVPIAIAAALCDYGIEAAIAVEIPHFLDRAGRVGG